MFGLACKGLHCAGCGKGLPLSLVLIIVGTLALTNRHLDAGIRDLAVGLCFCTAFAVTGTVILAWIFNRKTTTVFTRTDRLTYCQMKFLETGDREWLALTGGKMPEMGASGERVYQRAEIVRYLADD